VTLAVREVVAGSPGSVVGLLSAGELLPYAMCKACGLVFLGLRYAPEALREYYEEVCAHHYVAQLGEAALADPRVAVRDGVRFSRVARRVRRHRRRPATVVDVGGLDGRSLLPFAEAGARCHLVEPGDIPLHPRLPDSVVRHASLADLAASGVRADVVLALQTLEHLADLSASFATLREALAPDGVLYVEVPYDLIDLWGPLSGTSPFPPAFHAEHLNFFSATSLSRTALFGGLRPAWIRPTVQLARHGGLVPAVTGVFERAPAPRRPSSPLDPERLGREIRRHRALLRVRAKTADLTGRLRGYGGYRLARS
jgi:SAM-dependent methyltransferase